MHVASRHAVGIARADVIRDERRITRVGADVATAIDGRCRVFSSIDVCRRRGRAAPEREASQSEGAAGMRHRRTSPESVPENAVRRNHRE
jgi:hypothetical protein